MYARLRAALPGVAMVQVIHVAGEESVEHAQKIAAQTKQFQLPSNRNAPQPPESPRFADMKLIDYDQVKYGSVAERKRLIARWDKEVNATGK